MPDDGYLVPNNTIAGKWRLGRKVGSGAFGDVYEAQKIGASSDQRVAIKLQHKRHKEEEWKVLKDVQGCHGLPKIYHLGWEGDYHAIVMEMLGENLEMRCEANNRHTNVQTIAWTGIKCLDMLEALHKKGYVHADVKPDNFLLGLGTVAPYALYMVDLGLSMRFKTATTSRGGGGRHIGFNQNPEFFRGTLRYASLNIHAGSTLSRRDDLESLAYVLIYLHMGRLPWQGTVGTEKERRIKVREQKQKTPMTWFTDQGCPEVLVELLLYSRGMAFEAEPNYAEFKKKFETMITVPIDQLVPDWYRKINTSSRKRTFQPLQPEVTPKRSRYVPKNTPMMLLTVAQEMRPPRSQSYIHSVDFKEVREWIVKRWNHPATVYRITALCFSEGRWHCVMTSHSSYTVQSIKQSGSITTMKEWIEKKLREGFYITSIAGGTDSYVVVASKGTDYTDQQYEIMSPWPEPWVKQKWGDGYRITELATVDDKWMIILSKNSGLRKQCWEIHPTYPSEVVHKRWESGMRITSATSISDRLCLIMSRKSDYDSEHEVLRRSNSWPSDWVKEMWAENHFLTCITPFPAS